MGKPFVWTKNLSKCLEKKRQTKNSCPFDRRLLDKRAHDYCCHGSGHILHHMGYLVCQADAVVFFRFLQIGAPRAWSRLVRIESDASDPFPARAVSWRIGRMRCFFLFFSLLERHNSCSLQNFKTVKSAVLCQRLRIFANAENLARSLYARLSLSFYFFPFVFLIELRLIKAPSALTVYLPWDMLPVMGWKKGTYLLLCLTIFMVKDF